MTAPFGDTVQGTGLYTLRPIESWPREWTKNRTPSPFFSQYSKTLELLAHELSALRAANVVLQAAVGPQDFRRDGTLRASARPEHPGIIISFNTKYGPLSYACDAFLDWKDNVRAIALSLQALRKVDRYGVSRRGEQYRGWKALPSGDMTEREARDLVASYGGETEALRKSHPDHGGTPEDFQRVLRARKILNGGE